MIVRCALINIMEVRARYTKLLIKGTEIFWSSHRSYICAYVKFLSQLSQRKTRTSSREKKLNCSETPKKILRLRSRFRSLGSPK